MNFAQARGPISVGREQCCLAIFSFFSSQQWRLQVRPSAPRGNAEKAETMATLSISNISKVSAEG